LIEQKEIGLPRAFIRKICKDERGAALIEYTVLVGLITIAVCAMIFAVGDWMSSQWSDLNTDLQNCGANPNAGDPNASDNAGENAACDSAASNSN
jgi:pilus assembly protein Flp/PilA